MPPVVYMDDPEATQRAAEALEAGSVILYPTETVYGLGADACRPEAVARVRRIKGRAPHHPFLALVRDEKEAARFAAINEDTHMLARAFWPGPLTLVLPRAPEVSSPCFEGMERVALRVSSHPFCRALTQRFRHPIISTSANKSGEPTRGNIEEILASLGKKARYLGLVIDAGPLPPRVPSTLVDCTGAESRVVREGAVRCVEIDALLAAREGRRAPAPGQ